MWSLWTATCMESRCHRDAETQITLQMHWRQEPHVWAFCEEHGLRWIGRMIAMHPYFAQIEEWGVYQEPLELVWHDGRELPVVGREDNGD